MKNNLVILVSFSILSGTQSRNLESRVKCNIFDLSSGSSNSEFCDSRSDQLDHDDEKNVEFFCHSVWSNTSDPTSVNGFRIQILKQEEWFAGYFSEMIND